MLDVALIKVSAGDGGDGLVSFRREKYVPKGGPDGGDGGDGGSVVLLGERNLRTLDYFAGREKFEAENGGKGMKRKMSGKKGEDLVVKVPLGTQVFEITNNKLQITNKSQILNLKKQDGLKLIGEVVEDGQRLLVVEGGRGGRGNDRFKSASNQTPREAEEGEKGEKKWLVLELKLLADVGLVGLPNAGKSTLLSVITAARPKIADYPFTTLEPNLGVLKRGEGRGVRVEVKEVVIADIPGLIEGASVGKGLGDEFLRHTERCRVLVHLVGIGLDEIPDRLASNGRQTVEDDESGLNSFPDLSIGRLWEDYQTIRKELEDYGAGLEKKEEIVVINKIDLVPPSQKSNIKNQISKMFRTKGVEKAWFVSAATGEGVEELKKRLLGREG